MLILKVEGLTKDWNGKRVLENVNLEIHQGEKIALIGRNGVGKTTLLNCLLNRTSANGGKIYHGLPVQEWGIVEQHLTVPLDITVQEFVQGGHTVLSRCQREITRLEKMMEREKGKKLDSALTRYSTVLEQYQAAGGYQWEYQVQAILRRFSLSGEGGYQNLSGGQKTKAQLARMLARNPAFLLLDEPTNHLDVETMDWLVSWMQTFTGAVFFVSHDREFIDRLADKIVELTPRGTKTYQGGYRDFLQQREREQREQAALYKKRQQERRKLEEAIRRYREWFSRAHAAAGERNPFAKKKAEKNRTRFKAKEKALERLEQEQVERPKDDPGINLQFRENAFDACHLVRLENVEFAYGDKPVLENVNLTVSRGHRLAVTGANGSGKTTLLKLLSGKHSPGTGTVIHHPRLKIGYFAQELDNLREEETILDSLLRQPGMIRHEARNILACFFFRGDEVFHKIGSLSMGERCRVAFVKLYFSGANLMVLDEPTNYLDIPTREQIEAALTRYPGALVVVSHDRYLLKKVSNRVAFLKESKVEYYPGNYEEHQNHLRKQSALPVERNCENRILSLQLQLAQLMAGEEPEEEQNKKAYYAQIARVKKELDRLTT